MAAETTLEGAFAQAQADIEAANRAVSAVTRELKKARAAAVLGQVRELRRSLDSAAELTGELTALATSARADYDVDEEQVLASGAYAKELLSTAAEAGIAMFEDDDRLLCYPSIVRVLAPDLALDIDRRRVRGLRPTVVVAQLAKAQAAGPRFRAEPFLASVLAAYDLVVGKQGKAPGAVIQLVEVYAVLTLLPGQAKEYSKPEFARDLYLLDQSGLTTAGPARRVLRWAASSGTRQPGVLTTVARSGQQQRYWGIAFEPAAA